MTKELLTIEFRYHDKPKNGFGEFPSKTITIGVFDTLADAIKEGNLTIDILSKTFEVRQDDVFTEKGLFGRAKKLVTNACYPTKGIQYFAKITTLRFDSLESTITECFLAYERHLAK